MRLATYQTSAIKTICTLLFSSLFFMLSAQVSISGAVVDAAEQPVAFATVTFYDTDQKTILTGDYTDENGVFKLTLNQTGFLVISYVGSDDYQLPITTLEDTDLGRIKMQNSVTLEGVEVTAAQAQVTYKNGTLTYLNNGEAIAQDGVEFLKNVPLVVADRNDNLLIKGSTAKVLINGRDLKLQGTELQNYLKSLTPTQIEKVEVITNPSARYEAAGATGIINIILKEKPQGWFGTVGTSATYREVFTNRQNANVSYFSDKFGVSADVVRSDYGYYNVLWVERFLKNQENSEPIFREDARYDVLGEYYSGKLTTNYQINDHNNLSAFVRWVDNDYTADNTGLSTFTQQQRTVDFASNENSNGGNWTTGINYDWQIDTSGKRLTLDYLYVASANAAHTEQTTNFFTATQLTDNFGLTHATTSDYDVHSARVDYEQPLSEKGTLETGLKYSHVLNRSSLDYSFAAADEDFLLLPIMDNDFRYEEQVAAAYVSTQQEWNKWSLRTGLRAEYTTFNNRLQDEENIQQNQANYFNLFPNIATTYQSSETESLSFSYSRRLNRPYFRDLNASIIYATQYLYRQGNPFLQPEYTNNFEWSYKRSAQILTLYATLIRDGMSGHAIQDATTNVTINQTLNFAKNRHFGMTYSGSFDITKSTALQLNLTGSYQISELDFQNEITRQSIYSLESRASINQKITDHLKLNWSIYHSTPFLYGAYRVKGQFTNSFNLRYQKDAWSINLGMRDLFNAARWDSRLETTELSTHWVNRWRTGVISLGINYSFGNQKAAGKSRYRGKSNSEESQRM